MATSLPVGTLMAERAEQRAAQKAQNYPVEEAPARGKRPKSACYVPSRSRETMPGGGGAPMSRQPFAGAAPNAASRRPMSARSHCTTRPKVEQFRETGQLRWPPVASGGERINMQDGEPLRRYMEQAQENWKNELWMRSLRKPGVFMNDPVYSAMGGPIKDLHEEWADVVPIDRAAVPYSGSTASGHMAIPRQKDDRKWVERPVAHGKMAVDHMGGIRYRWDHNPRFHDLPAPCPLPAGEEPPDPPATLLMLARGAARETRRSGIATARY